MRKYFHLFASTIFLICAIIDIIWLKKDASHHLFTMCILFLILARLDLLSEKIDDLK